ncbi:MAG TPA: DUF2254 family protein [Longimicrobium sp.]
MPRDTHLLVRSTLLIAAGIAVLLLVQTLADVGSIRGTLATAFSFNPDEARLLMTALNRSFNQLMAIILTAVAIAVPLTANTYSVKLLETFIDDRVNRAVLLAFVFGVCNNLWLHHVIGHGVVPRVQLAISLAMALLYPSLLVPYLYYVFRFLQPDTLLRRLSGELLAGVEAAAATPSRAAEVAENAPALVEHVGSIGIRSVDRMDRTTAVETVHTLRAIVERYRTEKRGLPPAWTEAGRHAFGGSAHDAEVWLEARVFAELRALLSAAVPKMHAAVAAIADDACAMGLAPDARGDEDVDELVVEYFNTFIRLAVSRKDVRSLFILFHRYRDYAAGINADRPERALEIAFYFQYYARAACDAGMPFAVETVAHDLAVLVRRAWESGAPNRGKLLERMLAFGREATPRPLAGVKKAEAILAAFFLLRGDGDQAARIAEGFRGLERGFVDRLRDDIVHVRRERYWEVTDRRVNLDYVPDDQRAKVEEFFAMVTEAERTVEAAPAEVGD